jgi:hypothetical protein
MIKHIFSSLFFLLFLAGCGSDNDTDTTDNTILEYTFSTGTDGWIGGFADYAQKRENIYEFLFAHTTLPYPLNEDDGALLLSGNNHSDDLFMFIKRKIEGLEPNTEYALTFSVEFASNIADNMIGVGGAPGEGVLVKAGAVSYEPDRYVDEMGWYRMNIDKGNQTNGGRDMVVIGDFSNDTNENIYTLKKVNNKEPFYVTSNDDGEIWVIVGTDSGFEATTAIYYNTIKIVLSN